MKKLAHITFLCILLLTCLCFNTRAVSAKASPYKITKYKTFSAVQKDYLKKDLYRDFGLIRAHKIVKTKWGNKKAMIICQTGFTADIVQTNVFIKHKDKIYEIMHFTGHAASISKDKKYIFISGSGTFFMIYRYSGGQYRKYKYIFNDGQKEYDKKKKKLLKKYGVMNDNINYTHHGGRF